SPALAALLLRPRGAKKDWLTWLFDLLLGWLFRWFNFGMGKSVQGYTWLTGKLLRLPALVLVVYGGLLVLTWWGFEKLPRGFIPSQDMGYLVASVQLPDATAIERTIETLSKIERIALDEEGVNNISA